MATNSYPMNATNSTITIQGSTLNGNATWPGNIQWHEGNEPTLGHGPDWPEEPPELELANGEIFEDWEVLQQNPWHTITMTDNDMMNITWTAPDTTTTDYTTTYSGSTTVANDTIKWTTSSNSLTWSDTS